ncbi:Uncharacterised protein [Klebsiella pneumoniae]|nr:Uncharacterised protein [Klebsiella pneumoniae]
MNYDLIYGDMKRMGPHQQRRNDYGQIKGVNVQ